MRHRLNLEGGVAQRGFYATPTDDLMPESCDGHYPDGIEASLAAIESAAATDVRNIRNGSFVLSVESH